MHRSMFARARRGVALVAAILMMGALAGPAAGASEPFVLDLPAGLACADFDLRIEGIDGPGGSVNREFTDRDGNVVRLLSAGTGFQLVYTNLDTGVSLTTRSNGSGAITRIGPDGLQTVTAFGHVLVILFPSDIPAGPSTMLYVGRVVYTVDSSGVFTVMGSAGTRTDICAALTD